MKSADLFRLSVSSLGRRKLRSALTVIGVVIGVGALVVMVSLGLGLEREFMKFVQTDDLLRSLHVSHMAGLAGGPTIGPDLFSSKAQMLRDEDFEKIRAVPGVHSVTPTLQLLLRVVVEVPEWEEAKTRLGVLEVAGMPAAESPFLSPMLLAGEIWKGEEERSCLLPSALLERAHLDVPPAFLVGRKVRLITGGRKREDGTSAEPEPFTVAGVYDSERMGFKGARIYLPLPQALRLRDETEGGNNPFLRYRKGEYFSCEVKVADAREVTEVGAKLKALGYSIVTITDMVRQVRTAFFVVEAFLACIGAIGLIVSFFGIANTMAMAVLERTREIGIFHALGARRGVILRLFLMEATWIGVIGGVFGLLVGWGLGALLNTIAHMAFEVPPKIHLFHVSGWLAGGALLFAVVVSLVAGVMPAIRAARMHPVQALRKEG